MNVILQALPLENLFLQAGFGFVDAEYTDYQFSPTENFDGNTVPICPSGS